MVLTAKPAGLPQFLYLTSNSILRRTPSTIKTKRDFFLLAHFWCVMKVTPSQIICGVHLIKSKSICSPPDNHGFGSETGTAAAITAIPPLYFVLLYFQTKILLRQNRHLITAMYLANAIAV